MNENKLNTKHLLLSHHYVLCNETDFYHLYRRDNHNLYIYRTHEIRFATDDLSTGNIVQLSRYLEYKWGSPLSIDNVEDIDVSKSLTDDQLLSKLIALQSLPEGVITNPFISGHYKVDAITKEIKLPLYSNKTPVNAVTKTKSGDIYLNDQPGHSKLHNSSDFKSLHVFSSLDDLFNYFSLPELKDPYLYLYVQDGSLLPIKKHLAKFEMIELHCFNNPLQSLISYAHVLNHLQNNFTLLVKSSFSFTDLQFFRCNDDFYSKIDNVVKTFATTTLSNMQVSQDIPLPFGREYPNYYNLKIDNHTNVLFAFLDLLSESLNLPIKTFQYE